ncbi:MAG: hypothetical protein AB8G99_20410 [Planctomycetaceae bacterium]
MKTPMMRALCMLAVATGMLCVATKTEAANKKRSKRAITVLKVDPTAEKVKMFEAMDADRISVRMLANGPLGGKLLFENKTDKPLTVEMPEAFVGVHVLNQGLGGGLGGGGGGLGGGQGGGGLGGGQGGGQGVGGGAGGGLGGGQGGLGGGGGGLGGGGGNFFSIPPEKIVSVPYKSVCLEHGKTDPNVRMTYKVIPVEQFTKDPRVHELCKLVGTGRVHNAAAQAAAWHLSNNMSWQQLAQKQIIRSTSRLPYFTRAQLQLAQRVASTATGRAREAAKKKQDAGKDPDNQPPKTRKFR